MIDDTRSHVTDGMKLCALCFVAARNNSNRKSAMLKVDDDDFLFDMSPQEHSTSSSFSGSFQKTSVGRNTETGEIQGWQEFWQLVCLDDPSLG